MQETTVVASGERLSKRNLWGYSMGGIGRDMVYSLVNTALMTFILITKNVSAGDVAAITIIFLCCRIFDGANDPLMGAIIERTRTKWGKFKPWIFIGCLTNIVVVIALFFVPLKGTSYVIFFGFFYLLWGITYTMNDISYWGMMPSLTSNPQDRNNISTLANIAGGMGAGISIGATSLFGYGDIANQLFGGAINAYHVIALVMCTMFAVCQIMTCLVVKEKPLPDIRSDTKEKTGLKKIFKIIFHNDQLLAAAGSTLFYNVGGSILNLFACYWVWLRYGYQGTLVTIFSLLTACSAVVMVFYPLLSKKMSRKKIMTIAFITICIGYGLLLSIGLGTGAAHLSEEMDFTCFFVIAVSGSIAFFGQTLFAQVQTVSIANTVEYNDFKTGSRDESTIFSVRPFMAKMSSAIGVGIQGLGLLVLGINDITKEISSAENEVYAGLISAEQQQAKIAEILNGVDGSKSQWLLVFMSVLPLIFITVSYIIFMKKYTITEERYAEICEKIAERNKKEGEQVE